MKSYKHAYKFAINDIFKKTIEVSRSMTFSISNFLGMSHIDSLLECFHLVAKEQAEKDSIIHRGITCNNCGASPVKGIRYKCMNCEDYDICSNCLLMDTHNPNHIFGRITIPIPPLINPRTSLMRPFYQGGNNKVLEQDLVELSYSTEFSYLEVKSLSKQFMSLAVDNFITEEIFMSSVGPFGLEKNLLVSRLFESWDNDKDEKLNFNEFVQGLSILVRGNLIQKSRMCFDAFDVDEDGFISKQDMSSMVRSYVKLSQTMVRDVLHGMHSELDDNELGTDKPISSLFNAAIPKSLSPISPPIDLISQSATDEILDRVFVNDIITYEEFYQILQKDGTFLNWFESLGSVF
eukprot:NODE_49_length_27162_cov_0.380039.p8 type:complete len:349 gc:universal NODE_49_length_27162_cov_0.380039:21980-23026(+)